MIEALKPGERRLTQLQVLQLGEIHLKDDILRKEQRILELERANVDLRYQLWSVRADGHEKDSTKTYDRLGLKRGQKLEILEGGVLRILAQ
jgi:hypothetical protein